ncbi:MAG: type II toxin-antitoxin system Phd/YefM family antitoxin [Olsenella profusa]
MVLRTRGVRNRACGPISRITVVMNRTGKAVTVLRNNEPWVVIQSVSAVVDVAGVVVAFMDEYAGMFEELAKRSRKAFSL